MQGFFLPWPELPVLSLLLISLCALVLMFLLRSHAHAIVLRLSRSLHRILRICAQTCLRSEHRVRLRNHEVTIAFAEELMERRLEREFSRIEVMVEKDLIQYQRLTQSINEQIQTIREDYEASQDVPMPGPEWVAGVEAIAALKGSERNSEVMGKILQDLHRTVEEHQRDVLREQRWTVSARHKLLARLKPHWRRLTVLLQKIQKKVDALAERLRMVDRQMARFESLVAGSGHGLMASILMRFVIALVFVVAGLAATVLNVQLLSEPLGQLLGERALLGVPLGVYVACIHAAAILVAALLVSEGLKMSHLLPMIAAITDSGRRLMIILGVGLLTVLAVFEAFTVTQLAAAQSVSGSAFSLSYGLLFALGIFTPLMMSFVIVPLEYFLHTVRPISGSLLQVSLHGLAFACRALGALSLELGRLLVQVYDVIIFVTLSMESEWRTHQRLAGEQALAAAQGGDGATPTAADQDDADMAHNVTPLSFGNKK